jgi:hypothetical protein
LVFDLLELVCLPATAQLLLRGPLCPACWLLNCTEYKPILRDAKFVVLLLKFCASVLSLSSIAFNFARFSAASASRVVQKSLPHQLISVPLWCWGRCAPVLRAGCAGYLPPGLVVVLVQLALRVGRLGRITLLAPGQAADFGVCS